MELADKYILEGDNVFISGAGGCGKSHYIKHHPHLINAQYCGTTGVSAISLMNETNSPSTIHSFFSIGLGEGSMEDVYKSAVCFNLEDRGVRKHKIINRILNMDILIIDEASMLSDDLLDKIEYICRMIKGCWIQYGDKRKQQCVQLRTKYNTLYDDLKTSYDDEYNDDNVVRNKKHKIFGGVQLIFLSDLLQLPPVNALRLYNANCFDKLNFKYVNFNVPFRFTDVNFYNMLSRIRIGKHTKDDIETLNSRLISEETLKSIEDDGIRPTILFCKRVDVERYNMKELSKLEGEEFIFNAIDTDKKYKRIFDDIIPSKVILKVGCQVMLKSNLNVDKGLVNGTRGIITQLDSEGALIRVKSGSIHSIMFKDYWHMKDIDTGKMISRKQIPLILAYALTIHKSQGLTIDSLICNLGNTFSPGMVYVALSRARCLEDLYLLSFNKNKIKVSKNALDFLVEHDIL